MNVDRNGGTALLLLNPRIRLRLDGQLHIGRLTCVKELPVQNLRQAGWAPQPVLAF